jgi:riboflavin kinase/FMN adenylyltransferase
VVALTFWPHPLSILQPERAPALLTELPDRIRLLRQAGADQVRVVQFTRQLSAWSPSQFVAAVLEPLAPRAVVVGENFRFGHGAQAGGHDLADLAQGRFDVIVLPMLSDVEPLSSSRIRRALAAGDPARAARMLGRWFRYGGIVVQGDQRGRQLGFPTANLTVPEGRACPADGVYAGWLIVPTEGQDGREFSALPELPDRAESEDEWCWPAAVSIGVNPTFDGLERRVETYALDRTDLDLYGLRVGVDFVERLRPTLRFDGLDALVAQMTQDVATTRAVLAQTTRLPAPPD